MGRGDGSQDFGGARLGERLIEASGDKSAFGFGAIIDPGIVVGAFNAPAGFDFGGFEPCVDGVLAAFGADFSGVGGEGHVGETFVMQTAQIHLIGMKVGWAEPCA